MITAFFVSSNDPKRGESGRVVYSSHHRSRAVLVAV